jgi:probable HAF family extracellular repeat protein
MGAAENGVIDTSGFPGFDGLSQIRAFGWNGGDIFDLGTLGGTGAFPNAMNNRGQVVGASPTSPIPGPLGPPVDPFLWSNGKMQDLGGLGGTLGAGNVINNRGQVAGLSNLPGDEITHPFLWENGTMRDLGLLGGSSGNAEWLNDAGEVVGFSTIPDQDGIHAFLWRNGVMADLGTVRGDNSSNAFGINNKAQVVGQSWFFDGQQLTASHAFLWEDGGPMLDLNTLITNPTDLYVTEANFITDRGWIVANGLLPSGEIRTAILIPNDDASSNLALDTNTANEGLRTRPVPPTPRMLRSLDRHFLISTRMAHRNPQAWKLGRP